MRQLGHEAVSLPAIGVFIIVGFATWLQGAELAQSVAFALAACTAIVLWRAHPRLDSASWAPPQPEAAPGARTEVQLLGLSVSTLAGRAQPRAVERVRTIARDRLARHRLALGNPADRDRIVALIGEPAYICLGTKVAHVPTQDELLACLDALDRITV